MDGLLAYKIGNRAIKQLKRIRKSDRKLYEKLEEKIESIRRNPLIGDAKRGDLQGYFCLDVNHLGINYEICYTLETGENGEIIVIIFIGTREDFYAELRRYLGL